MDLNISGREKSDVNANQKRLENCEMDVKTEPYQDSNFVLDLLGTCVFANTLHKFKSRIGNLYFRLLMQCAIIFTSNDCPRKFINDHFG